MKGAGATLLRRTIKLAKSISFLVKKGGLDNCPNRLKEPAYLSQHFLVLKTVILCHVTQLFVDF